MASRRLLRAFQPLRPLPRLARGPPARPAPRRPLRATPAAMALPTPDALRAARFPDTVALSEQVLRAAGPAPSAEHLSLLAALLETSNGARGLYVTLLSDPDAPLADAPLPEPVLALLAAARAPEPHRAVLRDLLAKNVVMPATMLVHYARAQRPDLREGSLLTARRAASVARALRPRDPRFDPVLREMLAAFRDGQGRFAQFVTKWGYDREQCDAAVDALMAVLADEDGPE